MRRFLTLSFIVFFFGAHSALAAMHMMGEEGTDKTIESQMLPEWRACGDPKDCALVQYGCTGVMAANKEHVSEATDLARKIGGNPTEIKCAATPEPHYVPSCMNSQCFATNPTE